MKRKLPKQKQNPPKKILFSKKIYWKTFFSKKHIEVNFFYKQYITKKFHKNFSKELKKKKILEIFISIFKKQKKIVEKKVG